MVSLSRNTKLMINGFNKVNRMSKLLQKTSLKGLVLQNRVVMAPMTRARTSQPGNIPNEMMATYYKQRASAGLIISEATQVSDDSQGYSFTPGVYTDEQVKGWQFVTKSVQEQGAAMFCQLWHVGRVSHPTFQKGELPIAPSALSPVETKVWISDEKGNGNMVDCIQPREMTQADIDRVIKDFAQSAKKAIEAGFNGVEIHGGNGYLIDQFLRTNSNKRTDNYGGTRENRTRFLLEVVDAVIEAIGADKVGVRLAPFITFKDMDCPDIVPTILDASKELQARDIAYMHLSEADWDDAPVIPESFRITLREIFTNTIIVAGSYTQERADEILDKGYADLVAFGRPFVSNPDLVSRLENNYEFSGLDGATLFGGNEFGYIDYPMFDEK
jgi:N-ethylmaleimide reductase